MEERGQQVSPVAGIGPQFVPLHSLLPCIAVMPPLPQPQVLTRRQGLSVWAPMRLKPLPGTYWPPTAKAMMVEEFLVRKYWGVGRGEIDLIS